MSLIETEVEILLGVILHGDLTPAVFELLKDSNHLDTFIAKYDTEQGGPDVSTKRRTASPIAHDDVRTVFERWLTDTAKPVAFHGTKKLGSASIKGKEAKD